MKSQGPSVRIGDIVVAKDNNIKRIFWRMARVMELLKDTNEVARAALINVSNENGPPKVLKRSIRYLIPIEVIDTDEEVTNTDNTPRDFPETTDFGVTTDSSVSVHPTRSWRQAAVTGEAICRTWTGH